MELGNSVGNIVFGIGTAGTPNFIDPRTLVQEFQPNRLFAAGPVTVTVSEISSVPVPEPATLPLFATGLGLMALLIRRRRQGAT
jgi:hypothetical protein